MNLFSAILLLGGSSSSFLSLPQVKQTSPGNQQASQQDYRLKNDVNVRVIEYFDDSNMEEHYHQERPLIVDTETGTFKYDSECHWLTGTPVEPVAKGLPFTITTPLVIPEWRFPPPIVVPPDDIFIPPISKPTVRPTTIPSRTRANLEVVSKPRSFSDEELAGVTAENRGGGAMFGPQIQMPLPPELTRWLPFEATVSIYGAMLFGETEIYNLKSDVESYTLGVRMTEEHTDLPSLQPSEQVRRAKLLQHDFRDGQRSTRTVVRPLRSSREIDDQQPCLKAVALGSR